MAMIPLYIQPIQMALPSESTLNQLLKAIRCACLKWKQKKREEFLCVFFNHPNMESKTDILFNSQLNQLISFGINERKKKKCEKCCSTSIKIILEISYYENVPIDISPCFFSPSPKMLFVVFSFLFHLNVNWMIPKRFSLQKSKKKGNYRKFNKIKCVSPILNAFYR